MWRPFFLAAVTLQLATGVAPAGAADELPFVGCRVSVQGELHDAPKGPGKSPTVTPAPLAERLAFYKADNGPGVLAPRGWNCIAVAGTNGQALYVAPVSLAPELFTAGKWEGFTGAAIQLDVSLGDTSGRFHVAQIVARVFPKYGKFVEQVIAEKFMPASEFPSGPYRDDQLHYLNDHTVEYQTPSASEGLGTHSRLKPSNDRIDGVVIFDAGGPQLIQLTVRLPPDLVDLTPVLIQQFERDGPTHP